MPWYGIYWNGRVIFKLRIHSEKQWPKNEKYSTKTDKFRKTNVNWVQNDLLDLTEDLSSKLMEIENHSRRNNLQANSVSEVPKDTWELHKQNIKNTIQDKLGVEKENPLDWCHWKFL